MDTLRAGVLKGIIEEHGGRVSVQSEEGRRIVVKVNLPVVKQYVATS